MSIIDTVANSVVEYTAGITKPLHGQRLSVVYWKIDKTTGVKKDSKCTSIPIMQESDISMEHKEQLLPFMLDMLHTVQNKIIREMIEAGTVHVSNNEIDVASCIQYLEDSITSSSDSGDSGASGNIRLNKEMLNNWFDVILSDKLLIVLGEKLCIDENSSSEKLKLLETTLAAFKAKIASLSAGNIKLDIKSINSLRNAINIAHSSDSNGVDDGKNEDSNSGVEDRICRKLLDKLSKMERELNKSTGLIDII